jgi:hypothetical protein
MKKIFVLALMFYSANSLGQDRVCYQKQNSYVVTKGINLIVYKQLDNFLFQIVSNNNVHDELAFVNVNVDDLITLRKVSFYRDKIDNIFIIELGINGSTFGANQFLIIWNKKEYWNLSKVPFIRSTLTDVDSDGLEEFQILYPEGGNLYKFNNGLFEPYLLKK